jgi:4-amino-4-deoxy-L-arabinose transferase-like glycosyltransferase
LAVDAGGQPFQSIIDYQPPSVRSQLSLEAELTNNPPRSARWFKHLADALDRIDTYCRHGVSLAAQYPLRGALLLLAIALPAFLSGFFDLPPIDRTEVRYAQISKQMLETGDYINPSFLEEREPSKPIGVFWLQAASASLIGDGVQNPIWAYRVPSLLGALLAVFITYLGARRLFGREAALIGAVLLGVNIVIVLQAHLALSKGLHLAFVAAGQWSLAHLYISKRDDRQRCHALMFWTAQGGSILTGVLALPLLSLCTIVALVAADRDAGWLRRLHILWGLPLACLIAVPWMVALALNADPELVRGAWADGFFDKLAGPQRMNWSGFPGMYFAGLWLCLLPGSVLFLFAAKNTWASREERAHRFLLAWIVPYLIVLELLSDKPPLYSLQAVLPAVMVGIAAALTNFAPSALPTTRRFKAYWSGALLHALLPALGLAGFVLWSVRPFTLLPLLLALVAAAGVVMAHLGLLKGRSYAWLGLSVAASLLFYVTTLQIVVPNFKGIWTSARMAEISRAIEPCVPGRVLVADYGEPSAVFDIGSTTYVTKGPAAGQSAANWLDEGKGRIAFVTDHADANFHDHVKRIGLKAPLRIACTRGFNVGRFFWTNISLYVVANENELAACRLPEFARCETQD